MKAESLYVDRLGSEQQLPLEKMFLALLVVEISWFEKLWRVRNKWGGSAKKMTRAIRGGKKIKGGGSARPKVDVVPPPLYLAHESAYITQGI